MTDNNHEHDEGTIAALLERSKRRIPNLLAIKERLEAGDTLSNIEIEELGNHLEAAEHTRDLMERHPEFQELSAKMISLYEDIMKLAIANEEKAASDKES